MVDERTLVLPLLVGSRRAAELLAYELEDVEHRDVVLDARELEFATESAANRFVEVFLLERGARSLALRDADDAFTKDVTDAAEHNGVKLRSLAAAK